MKQRVNLESITDWLGRRRGALSRVEGANGVFRRQRQRNWVGFRDHIIDEFDRLVQLRVATLKGVHRKIGHFDVGRDTLLFNRPVAVEVGTKGWNGKPR